MTALVSSHRGPLYSPSMVSWSRRVLLLAALLVAGGCPRASDPVQPEATGTPAARPAATISALPTSPSMLTLHPSTEPVQWFDPPQASLRIFDVSGTPYFTDGSEIMHTEGDRVVTVPITYAEPPHQGFMPVIVRVYGHHPSPLWFDLLTSSVARAVVPSAYRQVADGRFAEVVDTSLRAVAWDDDRMLTLPSPGAPMRWIDQAGTETVATLRGPSPDCLWQPGPTPVTSRGWVLTTMWCTRPTPRRGLWLFDPSAHGRPIAGLDDHEAQSLIVLADGETWFTAAAQGQPPQLCHLVGDHARCDKIPTSSPWARSLGGRESSLSFVARGGVWTYRNGTFHRESLLLPDGSEGVLEEAVRDRSQRLWGIVRERATGKSAAGVRLFVRSP